MFDQSTIYNKVQEFADKFLSDGANQKGLELFVEKVKGFAEDLLESCIFSRAENEAILNLVNRDKFLNFSTGYVSQMREWQREHPIKINIHYSDIDETCIRAELSAKEREFVKRHLIEAGIGTIVSIGIGLIVPGIGGIIAGIIAELIVLLVVKRRYEQAKGQHEKLAEERIKAQVKARRDTLINKVTRDIKEWITAAEEKSMSVQKNFEK